VRAQLARSLGWPVPDEVEVADLLPLWRAALAGTRLAGTLMDGAPLA
ncbi:tRNA glutamyl-Q(34) synthetase GluQRS, partial [Deinococcus sp. 6YEL10]|nr:tRNA glutamyl-Q(34) synthetase GluQRS [Deinococcus sp. 6YEL10]